MKTLKFFLLFMGLSSVAHAVPVSYIISTGTLQRGATVYVTSATIVNLDVNSIRVQGSSVVTVPVWELAKSTTVGQDVWNLAKSTTVNISAWETAKSTTVNLTAWNTAKSTSDTSIEILKLQQSTNTLVYNGGVSLTAIAQGANTTLTQSGSTLTIAASASGSGGGGSVAVGTGTALSFSTVTPQASVISFSSNSFAVGLVTVSTAFVQLKFSEFFRPEIAHSTQTTDFAIPTRSTSTITPYLAFDASTIEDAMWTTNLSPYNGRSLKADIYYSMLSATSGDVIWEAQIACVSPGDGESIQWPGFAQSAAVTSTVPGTERYMKTATITLNDDACVPGDSFSIRIMRNAASGSDTASGDAEVRGVKVYED